MRCAAFALIIATASVSPLFPAIASAQNSVGLKVRYGDLNLEVERDVAILMRRINGVADYACGGEPTSATERGANEAFRACHKETVSAVLKSIASPQLTPDVVDRLRLRLTRR